jgi:hypothetical protein
VKTNIIVKWDLEGEHAWPMAPVPYTFLGSRHRHLFYFEVHIPVLASRQLEFLEVRRDLMKIVKSSYGSEPCDFRGMSCEELAHSVYRSVENRYKVEPTKVVVMEDAFVGSEVVNDG